MIARPGSTSPPSVFSMPQVTKAFARVRDGQGGRRLAAAEVVSATIHRSFKNALNKRGRVISKFRQSSRSGRGLRYDRRQCQKGRGRSGRVTKSSLPYNRSGDVE